MEEFRILPPERKSVFAKFDNYEYHKQYNLFVGYTGLDYVQNGFWHEELQTDLQGVAERHRRGRSQIL